MIEEFFGLNKTPMTKGVSTDDIFMSASTEECLGRLGYTANNLWFATLTGDCGVGKSTLLRKYRDSLDPRRYLFLYLADSKLTPRHMYNGLLKQLGQTGAFYRGDSKRLLHTEIRLIMSNNPERRIVVVIDEAHLLEKEMMEEVRILLNDQMDSISPVSLILSGQSEIRDRLEMKAYAAINQRIDIRCKLHPLDRVVTHQFIEHQLSIVGAKRRIFSEIAMDEVYNFSGGYPRKICKLCLASLICAASRKETTIDDQMVKDVIESEMS